jgi:hypothetical protein
MNKLTFITKLQLASESAIEIARKCTYNEIAQNLVYKIKPNSLELGPTLTSLEKENLIARKKELKRSFTTEEVANRLVQGNSVPDWINCSIIRSTKRKTTIELFTSRKFRDESKLCHQNGKNAPFHAMIVSPPYLLDNNEKFDVNWRYKSIQSAIKLSKARKALKKKILKRTESIDGYWATFDELCGSLAKRNKVEIAERLITAKTLVNGLTDGWHNYRKELDDIYGMSQEELTDKELVEMECLRRGIKQVS